MSAASRAGRRISRQPRINPPGSNRQASKRRQSPASSGEAGQSSAASRSVPFARSSSSSSRRMAPQLPCACASRRKRLAPTSAGARPESIGAAAPRHLSLTARSVPFRSTQAAACGKCSNILAKSRQASFWGAKFPGNDKSKLHTPFTPITYRGRPCLPAIKCTELIGFFTGFSLFAAPSSPDITPCPQERREHGRRLAEAWRAFLGEKHFCLGSNALP